MLAPKTNSEPRNLNFSLQKSQQTARFELNSTSKTPYVAIDERGLVRSIHLFLPYVEISFQH